MLQCTNVVHQQDINAVKPQALQIVLKRAHDPVVAIIVDHVEWQRINHSEFHWVVYRPGFQEPPDLVRKHVIAATQSITHRPF